MWRAVGDPYRGKDTAFWWLGTRNRKGCIKTPGVCRFVEKSSKKQGEMGTRDTSKGTPSFSTSRTSKTNGYVGCLEAFVALNSCSKKGHKEEIGNITGWINAQASEESQKMPSGNGILEIDLTVNMAWWIPFHTEPMPLQPENVHRSVYNSSMVFLFAGDAWSSLLFRHSRIDANSPCSSYHPGQRIQADRCALTTHISIRVL